MSNERVFVWAQGAQANVIEPLAYLKESGWRYGDVPMASNVNWLFKTLTEEIATLKKDIFTIKDDISRLREDVTKGLHAINTDVEGVQDRTKEEFSNVRKEVANSNEKISADVSSLKDNTARELSAVKKDLTGLGDSTTSRFNSLTQNMGSEFSVVRAEIERVSDNAEGEITKALEKIDVTFSEVRLEAAQTREMAIKARRQTTRHNVALEQLGFVGRKICRQLREMETDLTKLVPGYPPREWPREENLSAVPYEEGNDDDE